MTVAAFIPIKERSERVPGKNFRPFDGRPLYQWIILNAVEAGCFDVIGVDSDSVEVRDFAERQGCRAIVRRPDLAENTANGNDLLVHHASLVLADQYFQLFATAPRLSPATIRSCVQRLVEAPRLYDSIFTCTRLVGWFWCKNSPVNYRPEILPRSQDAVSVVRETTGLYGIRGDALRRYHCRIGARPIFHEVPADEAIDLDTLEDFRRAGNGQPRLSLTGFEPGRDPAVSDGHTPPPARRVPSLSLTGGP